MVDPGRGRIFFHVRTASAQGKRWHGKHNRHKTNLVTTTNYSSNRYCASTAATDSNNAPYHNSSENTYAPDKKTKQKHTTKNCTVSNSSGSGSNDAHSHLRRRRQTDRWLSPARAPLPACTEWRERLPQTMHRCMTTTNRHGKSTRKPTKVGHRHKSDKPNPNKTGGKNRGGESG